MYKIKSIRPRPTRSPQGGKLLFSISIPLVQLPPVFSLHVSAAQFNFYLLVTSRGFPAFFFFFCIFVYQSWAFRLQCLPEDWPRGQGEKGNHFNCQQEPYSRKKNISEQGWGGGWVMGVICHVG